MTSSAEAFIGDAAIAGRYFYSEGLEGFNFERIELDLPTAIDRILASADAPGDPATGSRRGTAARLARLVLALTLICLSSITMAALGQPIPLVCTEIGLPSYVPVKPSRPRSSLTSTGSLNNVLAMYSARRGSPGHNTAGA